MIYTITFDPCINYIITSNNSFNDNGLNNVNNYDFYSGGSGINASVVLSRLGFENQAITFLGGKTKNFFIDLLSQEDLNLKYFETQENTKINVKYLNQINKFDVNGPMPFIDHNCINKLLDYINRHFNSNDLVFIMGNYDRDDLKRIISLLEYKNIEFVLDIDTKYFNEMLIYKPYIVKPNFNELKKIVSFDLNSDRDILTAMMFIKKKGSKNVMVSNGHLGSYLLTEDEKFYKVEIRPVDNIVNKIGSGDTLISTFVVLYKYTNNLIDSLIKATSLSIGTATNMWLANKDDVFKYINHIQIIDFND